MRGQGGIVIVFLCTLTYSTTMFLNTNMHHADHPRSNSVSIEHEDTNPISAKATTAHGVMFALALLPAWRMLTPSS